jgi:hypothetical protein
MKLQTTRVLLALALAFGLIAAARWRTQVVTPAITPLVTHAAAAAAEFPVPITTVCGPVTEFQPATASGNGAITIGGVRLIIAAGASVGGFAVGANVCATFCFNPSGLVTNVIGAVTPNAGLKTTVCGIVSEWKPNQSIGIGGSRLRLQPWEVMNGQQLIAPGVNICLSPVYNGLGRVTGSSTVTFAPGTLPILVPALVHGTKYGPDYTDGEEGVFRLPHPFVLNVQTPIPAGVSVSPATPEHVWSSSAARIRIASYALRLVLKACGICSCNSKRAARRKAIWLHSRCKTLMAAACRC